MPWRSLPEDLAKVGVEGSNPFARSRFSQRYQNVMTSGLGSGFCSLFR